MTEAEWLTATDPGRMLSFLCGQASERKHRLFACACCRQVWDDLPDSRSRAAVEVAERYADGLVSDTSLDTAFQAAADVQGHLYYGLAAATTVVLQAVHASCLTMRRLKYSLEYDHSLFQRLLMWNRIRERIAGSHVTILNCVFGNPFRPVAFDQRWRSETAVALASAIYADRAFDRLPILADALEEAGCDHPDILSLCRGPGPHARGCWVVDLLLGKE